MIKNKWRIGEFTFKQFGYQKKETNVGETFFKEFGYQKKQIQLINKKHSDVFLSV